MGLLSVPQLFFAAVALAAAKPDGQCGYQCTEDSQCTFCGNAGKCSCPDGKDVPFYQESCSCVSAPADPPKEPPVNVQDSVWPSEWVANVSAWCYGDFSDKTSTANGRFYYNAALGRSRADWTPYTNGKDAMQIWIGDEKGNSHYYVKSGLFCLTFPITDPGMHKAPVGLEKPDWMKACSDAGFARYVGREQVQVDDIHKGNLVEWVDHWSCRVDYTAANQTITFQNWHSLGLGQLPKGLPLRVTGGNSAPNPTQGSPRLNSVWYNEFKTGAGVTDASMFQKPGGLCIPVGLEETHKFFGHHVTHEHIFSHDFHKRAHYLAHAKPSSHDLVRAKKPKPGKSFSGSHFAESMVKLNAILKLDKELQTQSCSNFTLTSLQQVQRMLFDARAPALASVYHDSDDKRRMAHSSSAALLAEQVQHAALEKERPDLFKKVRDGICHELVMWYVHHLSASAREEIKSRVVLPLLPDKLHSDPAASADNTTHEVHSRYKAQVSCAICHVNPSSEIVV
mmetsp:Transcript_82693/g.157664  ORF Transcript_82693/g.157664 Transcript_82693/m.157664 type:complete len:509 (-) Transcript_82693:77-1603(-)